MLQGFVTDGLCIKWLLNQRVLEIRWGMTAVELVSGTFLERCFVRMLPRSHPVESTPSEQLQGIMRTE